MVRQTARMKGQKSQRARRTEMRLCGQGDVDVGKAGGFNCVEIVAERLLSNMPASATSGGRGDEDEWIERSLGQKD